MNKNLKVLGVGVLLIGLAVAGWFLYTVSQSQNSAELTQNNIENQKQEQRKQESEGQVEELKTENIDTSNWKEYCNQKYGFCVKYPEEWEVKIGDNEVVSIFPENIEKYQKIHGGREPGLSVAVIGKEKKFPPNTFYRALQDVGSINNFINNEVEVEYDGEDTIDGILATKVEYGGNWKIEGIIFKHNDTFYFLSYDDIEFADIQQQIINSFRLVK